jgi:hypothetical protein
MAYVPKLSEQIVAEKEGREGPIEKEYREKLQSQVNTALGSPGASPEYSGMIAPMSQEQLRIAQEQQRLADALRAQAEGRAPSLAQMQFQRALEGSQAAIQSQLASARGLSPAQAQRIAARQQAALGANAAGQSAEMRLREQIAAQAALANLLAQSRQGALGGYQTAAELNARERGLRAEIASGIQTRDFGRSQNLTSAILNSIPAVGPLIASIVDSTTKKSNATSPGVEGFDTLPYQGEDPNAGLGIPSVVSPENLARGAEVPGKAKYRGDTRSNDTVPAMLSPGEIVLPRSVAQSPNAPDKAKQFVEAIKTKKKPSPKDYTQALMRLHELEARMDAMESLADIKAEEE